MILLVILKRHIYRNRKQEKRVKDKLKTVFLKGELDQCGIL